MTFERDLIDGLAQLLDAATGAVYRDSGVYAAGELGIASDVMPPAPDNMISLAAYPLSDHPTSTDSVVGLQVRIRRGGEDPRPVHDTAGEIFDALQAFGPADLASGVRVQGIERRSSIPLGQDQSGRWERSDNYAVSVHYPGTHRL